MQETTKYCIYLIVLSILVGLCGNPFLGFCGMLTAGLSLGNAMERTPDLIAMLSFITAMSAGIHAFTVMPLGFVLLTLSPERTCGYSSAMITRIESPWGEVIPASGQALPYPYNMTERAQGHQQVVEVYAPHTLKYAKTLHGVVCGENAGAMLAALGIVVILFAMLVVVPMMVVSLRLLRIARRNGGCAGCVSHEMYHPVVVTVPHPGHPRGPYVASSSQGPARPDPKMPIAQAVPVAQAASVRVAPTEMR